MAWLLFLLGTAAGAGGFTLLGSSRLAIDKVESLLLFLISAVLVTGGAVVRAVDRSRVIVELEEAIRGRRRPRPGSVARGQGGGIDPAGGQVGETTVVAPATVDPAWDEADDVPARRPRRPLVVGATVLMVALALLALWFVATTGK